MNAPIPATALQLRSLVQADGTLQVSLEPTPVPTPGADEVLIQMQATPINPSDIGLLFGPADLSTVQVTGTAERPVVHARIPERAMPGMAARIGQSMPVGNEGAGLVVAAGASPAAQALLGRTVAVIGGAMYTQYRAMPAAQCLPLPAGTTAAEGASCFVNPLTALGMVETMRREGHTALVHTAAASNLGQMLNKICQKDGIGLVNIVRKPEQAALLRGIGAQYVCDSSAPSFMADLTDALTATGATIAFDATGGGTLAGQILLPLPRAGAGMCARRRSNFLLRRQEKVTKEKATPLSVSPCARGNLRCSLQAGSAQTRLRLKQRAALIRLKLCSSARPEGKGSRAALRAIAALGPGVGSERGAGSLGAGFRAAQALGAQCNCRITISRSETRAQTPIPENA
jgi:NADPH:quinone reductase-like Zn-dependent oxidoreductase